MGDDLVPGEGQPPAWQSQSAVTVVAAVRQGALDSLRVLLAEMAADVAGNRIIPFARMVGVHFARFFVTPPAETADGEPLPAHLVFMSDFDGTADAHLERLEAVGGDGIDELLGHCAGYPAGRPVPSGDRLAYLGRFLVTNGVSYVNSIGRTVRQAHDEAELRDAIERFIDGARNDLETKDARAVRGAIRAFVAGQTDLRWALEPVPGPPLGHRVREKALFLGALVLALVLSPILMPVVLIWLLMLRIRESHDPAPPVRPDPAHLAELRSLEDHSAQNQFTALGFVKAGWQRRSTATVILKLVGFGARHIFNDGDLAGVKTIHFARWVPFDGGKRIVFASNFDGSTESYMDDFIDKVAWGLNAVFSNGVGYPSTHWLIFGGAKNEEAFKGYLRAHQLPTQVWFSAYDGLTALNMGNNARVRAGLSGDMSEAETQDWLRRL